MIFLNYYNDIEPKSYTIASFDLDHTLIKPKNNKVFPKDKFDWIWWHPIVKERLEEITDDKLLVIFSNQKQINETNKDDFIFKINSIQKDFGKPFIFIASTEDDITRKPRIGMVTELKNRLKIEINKDSFYVGDMAGRPNDKYDTDFKFAKNLKWTFYTPEEYFLKEKTEEKQIGGYKLNNNSTNTKINIKPKNNLLVMVQGYPGSGKSHLINKFSNFEKFSRDENGTKFLKLLEESMNNNKPVLVEGLFPSSKSRQPILDLMRKYKYNGTFIKVITDKNLAKHLNIYRNLFQNKNKVPDIVYYKYDKEYEEPNEDDWLEIIEYHPHISKKINKYYLY
jgi:bifunctional polynucleotide phosphatase/kinase